MGEKIKREKRKEGRTTPLSRGCLVRCVALRCLALSLSLSLSFSFLLCNFNKKSAAYLVYLWGSDNRQKKRKETKPNSFSYDHISTHFFIISFLQRTTPTPASSSRTRAPTSAELFCPAAAPRAAASHAAPPHAGETALASCSARPAAAEGQEGKRSSGRGAA